MSGQIKPVIQCLDTFSEVIGRTISWLTLVMVVVTIVVVILRYGLSLGSVWMQESVTYLHATVFLLGAAYTLKHDGHVRVDIFYRNFSEQGKAWVNAIGGIVFLLPLCAFMVYVSLDFVVASWEIKETSTNAGGIPAVFALKSLIPLMAITLSLQAISETLKSLLTLMNGDISND